MLARDSHPPQSLNPAGERRVSTEKTHKYLAGSQGPDDIERRGRRRHVCHRDPLVVSAQFLECADQPIGMAHETGSCGIGRIFTLARYSQLDQQGSDGRYNQH